MHMMTPRAAAFRAFSAGGARGTVNALVTWHKLQAMTGGGFKNEMFQGIEHFEPYGFTSAIIGKNADGIAEALLSFATGPRAHAIAGVIADRRYRPRGLKEGENAQYDDIGQMTLLRRTGLYLLSLDGDGGSTPASDSATGSIGSSGGGNQERMVSLRHVEKSKQPAVAGGSTSQELQQAQQSQEDYKHEGETVNTEVRVDKKRIHFYDGDTEVAYYDKQSQTWVFKCKDYQVDASGDVTIKAKGACNINGNPINFNGGGPTIQPFTVQGGGS